MENPGLAPRVPLIVPATLGDASGLRLCDNGNHPANMPQSQGVSVKIGRLEMANYFVTYDLNGPHPSHQDMDKHLEKLGAVRGRVLETVWYVQYPGTTNQLRDQIKSILRKEDLLLVIEAKNAAWTSLLIDSNSLVAAWKQAA